MWKVITIAHRLVVELDASQQKKFLMVSQIAIIAILFFLCISSVTVLGQTAFTDPEGTKTLIRIWGSFCCLGVTSLAVFMANLIERVCVLIPTLEASAAQQKKGGSESQAAADKTLETIRILLKLKNFRKALLVLNPLCFCLLCGIGFIPQPGLVIIVLFYITAITNLLRLEF